MMNVFDAISDDIVLIIFKHLTDYELSVIRQVSRRFESIGKDRELVRSISFTRCYKVSTNLLVDYLKPVKHQVEILNLNYCYWLSPRCCALVVSKCINLMELHLLHVQLCAEQLVTLLASLKKLQCLSVTLKDVREFQTLLDKNAEAQQTLKGVRMLTVQLKNQPVQANMMTMHFLAVTSFFEYCNSLEEFHVQGISCTKGIPPYVVKPQIKKLDNLIKIHTMSITDAIDPFARMFFFGALLEVCKLPEVHFRTLLQPLVVNEHLWRKVHFVTCMKRIEQLQNLDISQTIAAVPNEMYQLDRATNLQHLNVSDNSLIDSLSLHALADNCPHLVSINLRDCHHLHFARPEAGEIVHKQVDISGFQSLIMNCTALRHINISGVHIHSVHLADTSFSSICHLLALNTKWNSISLSPCCLCPQSSDEHNKNGKRAKLDDSGGGFSKRPRLGVCAPDLNMPEERELGTELGKLVAACPYVEQFELIGAGFRSAFSKRHISDAMQHFKPCSNAMSVSEEDVLCIRHWRQLRYLQLSAVPGINSGESLRGIVKGCPRLERLLLAHLGFSSMSSYLDKFAMDLPLARHLKDFRIEQSRLQLKATLWVALSQLQSLQRFCLLSKHDMFSHMDVECFVKQARSLVVLQLFTNNTISDCSFTQTTLVRAHKATRPALSICIFPMLNHLHQPLLAIPEFHMEGITLLSSTICLRPPGWDGPSSSHV